MATQVSPAGAGSPASSVGEDALTSSNADSLKSINSKLYQTRSISAMTSKINYQLESDIQPTTRAHIFNNIARARVLWWKKFFILLL